MAFQKETPRADASAAPSVNPSASTVEVRPEIRYDFSEDQDFAAGTRPFKDMWSVGADVIFKF